MTQQKLSDRSLEAITGHLSFDDLYREIKRLRLKEKRQLQAVARTQRLINSLQQLQKEGTSTSEAPSND